ncbi:MAG: hypothetical protein ACLPN1_10225, partial [Dissulfurispiraceae bacterium]
MINQKPSYFMGINLRKLRKSIFGKTTYRGIIAIIITIIFWEICARLNVPVIGMIPAPSVVFNSLSGLLTDPDYWESWVVSFQRVFMGF